MKIVGAWVLGDLGEKRAIDIKDIKNAIERGFDVAVTTNNGCEAIIERNGNIFVLPTTKGNHKTIKRELKNLLLRL